MKAAGDTPRPYPHRLTEEVMTSTVTTPVTPPVSATYAVAGMSCGHCEATLTRVIGALDGVTGVDVRLATGHVTVTGTAEPDDAAIAEVVDAAGYELTGRV
ncbi:putative metal associated protein [Streptomyces ambofaciens ATCC 23877]|uniref:Putative metal associated protein n=2 Tax=Streptomyces ambofaciens (strain ATCC 23877 / 3486 / DSM 40053 / JCM 4204 / NBRC 12836 / NRRL B-2516) TaxID=278992 RepID=A0A0K2AM60_STRA7|nr:putative metal associated protein [Streptomyces ambofaciens ATCC 23877]